MFSNIIRTSFHSSWQSQWVCPDLPESWVCYTSVAISRLQGCVHVRAVRVSALSEGRNAVWLPASAAVTSAGPAEIPGISRTCCHGNPIQDKTPPNPKAPPVLHTPLPQTGCELLLLMLWGHRSVLRGMLCMFSVISGRWGKPPADKWVIVGWDLCLRLQLH